MSAHPLWSVIPTELAALMDAVESAAEEGSGFDLLDIERVESFWQMLEAFSTAHGFVLSYWNEAGIEKEAMLGALASEHIRMA